MKQFLVLLWLLIALPCLAQFGSGNGSFGSVGGGSSGGNASFAANANGLVGQRVYYVSTSGNDATAVTNDFTHPWSANFSQTSGVGSLATNGDTIILMPGTYGVSNIWLNTGVTLAGMPGVSRDLIVLNATNGPTQTPPANGAAISTIQ